MRALQDWLDVAGVRDGPASRPISRHAQLRDVRLSDHAVAVIIKRSAKEAGMSNPELA